MCKEDIYTRSLWPPLVLVCGCGESVLHLKCPACREATYSSIQFSFIHFLILDKKMVYITYATHKNTLSKNKVTEEQKRYKAVTGSGTKAKTYVFTLYLPRNGTYFKSTY